MYPYTANASKVPAYNYGMQQNTNKDMYNTSGYNSQYNSGPQRGKDTLF